jgi:hypothetical protein
MYPSIETYVFIFSARTCTFHRRPPLRTHYFTSHLRAPAVSALTSGTSPLVAVSGTVPGSAAKTVRHRKWSRPWFNGKNPPSTQAAVVTPLGHS